MTDAVKKAIMTWVKYAFWTAVAYGVQVLIGTLAAVQLPDYITPIVGSVLKSLATFLATKFPNLNVIPLSGIMF